MHKLLRFLSKFNTLSMQIFTIFWIAFILLIGIILVLPQFSSRTTTILSEEETHTYQQQILTAFRENQISRLLIFQDKAPPLETMPEIHPILVNTQNRKVLGAARDEVENIRQFIYVSRNTDRPLTKTFDRVKVAGPFEVHINSLDNGENEEEPYVLYFAQREDPDVSLINSLFDKPWILFLIYVSLSTPILALLAWSIGRPIRLLRQTTNEVVQGNFKPNLVLEREGANEFRQVGRSFNHMISTLNGLFETRRMLLSSISHELRTPLTRLHLVTALLRRRNGDSSEITRMENEIERVNKMIDDLLKLSRNQLNIYMERDLFPITDLWDTVIADMQFEAKHKNIFFEHHLQITAPEAYGIYGNKESLTSAFENVLRNALKYTQSKVRTVAYLKGNMLVMTIDDDGEGLKNEEYTKIFRPFYRVDEARTRSTGGTGLGLAIVKNNINQHSGQVWAEKSVLGGLRITIEIPLYNGGGNDIFDN